jgi:hypothetical protein
MNAKKSFLSRVEILVALIILLGFMIWATSKCSASKSRHRQYLSEQAAAAEEKQDSAAALAPKPPEPVRERVTPLYVTIDGLKLRDKPSLDGKVLVSMKLHEEVIFLHEVTDSLQEINLGKEVVRYPWVKIRHYKGHEGWVYGAGVHYYKMKRAGVL